VKPETLPRVLDYWKSVDADTGKTIEELVHAGLPEDGPAPSPTERRGIIEETSASHAG
jgi:catalase